MGAVACLIAYSALDLRKALVDGSYRSRALWTAVGALSLVSFTIAGYVDSVFGNVVTTYTGVVAEAAAWGFVFLGLFGWVVSNANVAVEADYFNREVLFWKKGGRIAAPVLVTMAFALFNTPPFWLSGGAGAFYSSVIVPLGDATIVLVTVYAIAVLSVSYRHMMDRHIKVYTKWVALSVASVLAAAFSPSVIAFALFAASLFFMYQAVGALAIRTSKLSPA